MSEERQPSAEDLAEAFARVMAKGFTASPTMSPPTYDLLAEPKAYVFLQPGWAERLKELTPRNEQIEVFDATPPEHPPGEA
jgi:hypothetical protein